MSLAGAQPKLPVILVDGAPALPPPGQPTTHIVKPAIARFENYFDGELRFADGELATRKANTARHGLGLKSIRQTAEKYGGQASTKADDGWFTLTVLLPRPS